MLVTPESAIGLNSMYKEAELVMHFFHPQIWATIGILNFSLVRKHLVAMRLTSWWSIDKAHALLSGVEANSCTVCSVFTWTVDLDQSTNYGLPQPIGTQRLFSSKCFTDAFLCCKKKCCKVYVTAESKPVSMILWPYPLDTTPPFLLIRLITEYW